MKHAPSESSEEDVKKLHEVLKGLKVELEMPPNGLTYEQELI